MCRHGSFERILIFLTESPPIALIMMMMMDDCSIQPCGGWCIVIAGAFIDFMLFVEYTLRSSLRGYIYDC